MLLDSNIIIYSFLPEFQILQETLRKSEVSCSVISCVETLGYHALSKDEQHYLQLLFETITVLPITQPFIDTAIALRQQRKMSLGDALVAATALEHHQTLLTRNVKDFEWVEGLKVVNPL
ncbi:MAG: type II toxin-antitoxin system VapC family toxin [Candidatus Electrothrix sp. AUS4]|nr:type II toxin-antitoxin system VapC family toxin [Candidatus Electrothrix sp. AUS4]